MNGKMVIVGCGGHATSVAEAVVSAGYEIDCFVDAARAGETHLGYPVKPNAKSLDGNMSLVIGIGDNAARESVAKEFRDAFPNASFPAIIHKSASVLLFRG